MILFDTIMKLFSAQFTYPWLIYVGIGAIVLLLLLTFVNVVRAHGADPDEVRAMRKRRTRWRVGIFISRTIIVGLLFMAMAGPYIEDKKEIEGNLQLNILIDNSTSMSIFDNSKYGEMIKKLGTLIPTKTFTIASGLDSSIGNGVLSHLEPDMNYLLITDGQVNSGTPLNDIVLFGSSLNSTISAVTLFPDKSDIGVEIFGPSKSVESVENTFKIVAMRTQVKKYHIKVWLDSGLIIDRDEDSDSFTFTETLGTGDHKIKSEVTPADGSTDFFSQNNIFYKTVRIVDKPKILFISKEYAKESLITDELYDVTHATKMPSDVSEYSTVILKDIPGKEIDASMLIDYVTDGNGLIVIGGDDSFDFGEYENTLFEKLLPVSIGTGENDEGDGINIVLVMDISKSGMRFASGGTNEQEIFQKSLAIGLLDGLKNNTKVGAVAFSDKAYLISRMRPIGSSKELLANDIARLNFATYPGTNVFSGLAAAYQTVARFQGSKNIILISDGKDYPKISDLRRDTLNLVNKLAAKEYRFYTISPSPESDQNYLKKIASDGKGFFFEPATTQKLKIMFGPPKDLPPGGYANAMVLDDNHFITRKLELDALLNSYNLVTPKSQSQELVALETGQPVLTVWRYGLGRVGAFTAGSAKGDLGQLLTENNSQLIPRTINWAVGDPERNEEYFVAVKDGRENEDMTVVVKSNKFPEATNMTFSRIDEDLYSADIPPRSAGQYVVLSTPYAINYHTEYSVLGMQAGFEESIVQAGGRLFHPDEVTDIYNYVKSRSKRIKTEKINIQWPLIVLALFIYFIEIIIRRIIQTFFH